MDKIVAFDFETYLISKEALFPRAICVTVATGGDSFGSSNADEDFEEIVTSLFDAGHTLVGHNVSFDIGVACAAFPHLLPRAWEKLEAGEVVDTRIFEMLTNLATHGRITTLQLPDGTTQDIKYGLSDLALKYLGIDMSAEKDDADAWRYRYSELDGTPWEQFPATASSYAQLDAVYTLQIFRSQLERARVLKEERGVDSLVLLPFQTAVDFSLATISSRGMDINKEEVRRVEAMLLEEFHAPEKTAWLREGGILVEPIPAQPYARQITKALTLLDRPEVDDWTPFREELEAQGIKFKAPVKAKINTKKLKDHVELLCTEHGFPLKRTATKEVSVDKEVQIALAPVDPIMNEYRERMALNKLVTTELPALYWEDEPADRVFFNYNILVETGRTSSFGNSRNKKKTPSRPACNGQQRDPRIRPCFVPRPGYWLLSVDYSALELVSTAQATYDILGFSKHRDKINDGYDLHSYLGGQLALFLHEDFRKLCIEQDINTNPDLVYECFRACKTHEDVAVQKFFSHWRKFAKPVGLGYPGGLGAKTFLEFAKTTYDVDVAAIAAGMPDDEFEITSTLLWHAKRMGITEDNFRWTRYLKALALAIKLKQIWLETYPEMGPYFEYISDKCKDPYNADMGTWEDGRTVEGLCYTTPLGMHRAACTFTKAANGRAMQSPSAEGFKIAVFNTVRACEDPSQNSLLHALDSHVVNEIHDEILSEVPAKVEEANLCATEIQRLMEESMSMVMPDVRVSTEACLMKFWTKQAQPVKDDQGRLIPWEPREEKTS